MSPRQALASTLHLFIVLAFFLGGLVFVALPYFPEVKTQIFEQSTLIGLGLFLTAVILLLGFYALDRGRYLVIKMGIEANVNLVRQCVEECLSQRFSKKIALTDVEIANQGIEIRVAMAPLDEDAREQLFVQVERQLGLLLKQRFGYNKPFHLIVKI